MLASIHSGVSKSLSTGTTGVHTPAFESGRFPSNATTETTNESGAAYTNDDGLLDMIDNHIAEQSNVSGSGDVNDTIVLSENQSEYGGSGDADLIEVAQLDLDEFSGLEELLDEASDEWSSPESDGEDDYPSDETDEGLFEFNLLRGDNDTKSFEHYNLSDVIGSGGAQNSSELWISSENSASGDKPMQFTTSSDTSTGKISASEFNSEEPGSEESGSEKYGSEEPVSQQLDSEEPGSEELVSKEHGSEEPGSEEPGSEEPGSEEPGSEEPGSEVLVLISKEIGSNEPGSEERGSKEDLFEFNLLRGDNDTGSFEHYNSSGVIGSGGAQNSSELWTSSEYSGAGDTSMQFTPGSGNISGEINSGGLGPEETGPEEPVSEELVSEELVPKEPGSKEEPGFRGPGLVGPSVKEPGSDEPGSKEPGANDIGPEEPGSKEPSSEEFGSKENSAEESSEHTSVRSSSDEDNASTDTTIDMPKEQLLEVVKTSRNSSASGDTASNASTSNSSAIEGEVVTEPTIVTPSDGNTTFAKDYLHTNVSRDYFKTTLSSREDTDERRTVVGATTGSAETTEQTTERSNSITNESGRATDGQTMNDGTSVDSRTVPSNGMTRITSASPIGIDDSSSSSTSVSRSPVESTAQSPIHVQPPATNTVNGVTTVATDDTTKSESTEDSHLEETNSLERNSSSGITEQTVC